MATSKAQASKTKARRPAPPQDDDFFDEPAAGDPSGVEDVEVLDLSDVNEDAGFEPLPAGIYNGILSDAEYGISQRSSKPMITWMFEVSDGDFAGRQLRYYTVLQGDAGLGRLKKLCVRIAPEVNLAAFSPATTPSEMVGAPCRLQVAIKMYQGERRNDLKDVLAPATERMFDE